MGIIRVTGKGQFKLRPDITRITMTLEGTYPKYSETLRRSAQDTEQLKNTLTPFGFARTEIKTLSFAVDSKYETYWEEKKHQHQRHFLGYEFHHSLKVEFDSDNERLGKILDALASCSAHPEFSISYAIKDEQGAKNALLGKAVEDAKAKAVVLAQAAGVTLRDIQSIDYSWGKLNMEVRPMATPVAAGGSIYKAFNADIEPDDVELSDTVTVIWEIQ